MFVECQKKATTAVLKALQCITNPSFRGNAATQHGLSNETVARLQFQKDFGLVAEQRGIFVCKEKPWLSATPDGIIESHSAILEIKCPFALDCKEVIRRGKYDVVEKDGTYMLNKNGPNGYYSQVQFTMLCTRKQRCLFTCGPPRQPFT
uniref:YqaJ viral recombinase domain-containing protein n=1 Tax=Rhipicephalus pulchellus TaxID=72859 RepID=L7LX09_RHIPC